MYPWHTSIIPKQITMKRTLLIIFATLSAGTLHVLSADWPQWQGPDRTAHSKEIGLLKEWPKDGPKLAWKVKGLGGGDSLTHLATYTE